MDRKFNITEAYIQALQESADELDKLYSEWINLLNMIPSDDLDDYVVGYDVADAELDGNAELNEERLKELIDGADYVLRNKVFEENKQLNEEFTIDTFNNKYKPLYNNSVEIDGNEVYADNIKLRGSGIDKRVEATLKGNKLSIDNEYIGISFDGNNINVYGQYWFTSDFNNNEEFNAKITKAVKELYNDMKKLQQPIENGESEQQDNIPSKPNEQKQFMYREDIEALIPHLRDILKKEPNNESVRNILRKYDNEFTESKKVENKDVLEERKKYWPPEHHIYEIDGHNFDFECLYYEVSGSNQASLWGHTVNLYMDGSQISTYTIPYYNRTWETFKFQMCMINALRKYMDACKDELLTKYKNNNNTNRTTADQKNEILSNNEWYQMLERLYKQISNGDKGKITENKELKAEGQLWGEDDNYDREMYEKMQNFANQLVTNLTNSGWDYDDTSAKFGHYRFKKGNVEIEYCDNVDKVGYASIESNNINSLKEIANEIDSDYYDGNDYVSIDFNWNIPNVTNIVEILNNNVELKTEDIENKQTKIESISETFTDENGVYRYGFYERECPMCGNHYGIIEDNIKNSIGDYINGYYDKPIQDLFPGLNPMEREFIKSGFCPDCQKKLFGNKYTSDLIKPISSDGKMYIESKNLIEDIDDECDYDEEDPYGETISLFARAYREVPDDGVEEWGKDDEYYFCLDTKKFLSDLENYEVEIPKKLVDEASYDDWSNGIDDYLMQFVGIDPDDCKEDNTYNWGSRLTHDLNLRFYDTNNGFYVAIEIHKSGDVRGNYTTRFLLRFDDKNDWHEACFEAQANNKNTLELNGKHYTIEPDFWSEHCNIWCEEDNNGWDGIYCEDLENLKNIIATEEPTIY